jgi:hypothetical protein
LLKNSESRKKKKLARVQPCLTIQENRVIEKREKQIYELHAQREKARDEKNFFMLFAKILHRAFTPHPLPMLFGRLFFLFCPLLFSSLRSKGKGC